MLPTVGRDTIVVMRNVNLWHVCSIDLDARIDTVSTYFVNY